MPSSIQATNRSLPLFLGADDVAAIIRRKGLAACFHGLLESLRADFLRWPEFDKCARVASHSAEGVIELMPISDSRRYGFKYVNGHPRNTAIGLPTVMAFGVLADVATGMPLLVSELTLTTAMRTAVTSVLAAQALARADSRVMALIGNGAQSEFQALAFHHLLGIRQLRLFDVDPAAMQRLASRLRAQGLQVICCASAAQAAEGADIVTTATADKARAAIVTPDMVAPGMHLNAIGGDCPGKTELHPQVLRSSRVFVEYEPQSRVEGDIQQLPADFPVTELWRVLAGEQAGRRDAQELTVFDSVGFALEDWTALGFMHQAATELGLGRPLALVPLLRDPKDLFGLIEPAAPELPLAA